MRRTHPWLLLCLLCCSPFSGADPVADADTRLLLRDAEFTQVEISPNGKLLAIARRTDKGMIVSVNRIGTLEPVSSVDPGKNGEIDGLRWLDDERLLVAASRVNGVYGVSLKDPTLYIVSADGKDVFTLPANFVSTIEGDKDHILVSKCGNFYNEACTLEIRRANIRKAQHTIGELVIAAPGPHTDMIADRYGNVRFAIGWEDDSTGRTYTHVDGQEGWTLINDGSKTGTEMVPFDVSDDGKTGYLITQHETGADFIESYDFATGKRTELYRHPASDPMEVLYSFENDEPIGAVYDVLRPTMHFWKPEHPDAITLAQLQQAFPGKRLSVASASDDGQMLVLFVSSDRDAGAFYTFDRPKRKAAILARSRSWVDPESNGPQQGFEFKARDGLGLRGIVTLPPRSAGKMLPTVVVVHGGPYGVLDSWGYDTEAQILARHGYAVVQVNFRGSGGQGKKFMDSGTREWGRAMQDDVTDATRWAIAQGIADPARVCIYGASYGGYSALMGAAREPTLYRCAAGRSGVFDLAKMYSWGSIRRSDVGLNYLKTVLGEDPADLASRSPAKLADKITVPVLLAHGRLDSRVDLKHARVMESALKKNGKPSEMVLYSYMGHSMILEEQRQDFYARLLEFLQRHIGAGQGTAAPAPAVAAPVAAAL